MSIGLFLVIRAATPLFRRVFRKYDALNDSVQENVQAMRVVKSYVREDMKRRNSAQPLRMFRGTSPRRSALWPSTAL